MVIVPSAGAQAIAPSGGRDTSAVGSATLAHVKVFSRVESERPSRRIAFGMVDAFGGAFIVGAVGVAAGGGCRGDMCGFSYALAGAAIGSVVFAGFVSDMPTIESKCAEGTRDFVRPVEA